MTFNYRKKRSWQPAIAKRRENGQWIEVGSGGRGIERIPNRYYTEGPPQRDGDIITYNDSYSGSLQDAHDELAEGDTLFIDPADSPYTERLTITTSHITIDGGGELSFDDNGNVTEVSEGAWIESPDTNDDYAVGTPVELFPGHSPDTSLAQSITGGGAEGDGNYNNTQVGDEVIYVRDASAFSSGDWIYVWEDRIPYGEPISGGGGHASVTQEYRQVTDVDTGNDALTVDHPMMLPFPNNNSTEVGVIDWDVEDLRITGLNARGHDNVTGRAFEFGGVFEGWFDNLRADQGHNQEIACLKSCRLRIDNIFMTNASDYGFNFSHGTSRVYSTNITGDGHGHYTVRLGSGGTDRGASAMDHVHDRITGRNYNNNGPVTNAHSGGFFAEFRNVFGDGERVFRPRSWHLTCDGFQEDAGERATIEYRQRPFYTVVKNGEVTNKVGSVVFMLGPGNVTSYENERIEYARFENITIEAYDGRDATEIGSFGDETNGGVHHLIFHNVEYDGEWLTESDVMSWDGYDSITVNDLTVTHD